MLLRWIAVFMLSGALIMPVCAAEKDAPLPFDDPSSAPQIAKKKKSAAKSSKRAKSGVRKKQGTKSKSQPVAKKSAVKKPVAKKPR